MSDPRNSNYFNQRGWRVFVHLGAAAVAGLEGEKPPAVVPRPHGKLLAKLVAAAADGTAAFQLLYVE